MNLSDRFPKQVGDAKEPIRKGVRNLFREICSFFSPSKLFVFVLDGLKSKNARQRTGLGNQFRKFHFLVTF